MKSWFNITARAGKGAISIFDEIGTGGITAAAFEGQLKAMGKVSAIELSINSPGGSVFDSLAIYNMLRRHPAKVTARIDGVAASGASLIAMAADLIVMPSNSFLMVHNPAGGVIGTADDMKSLAEALEKMAASMAGIYAARSGLSVKAVEALMKAETWLNAEEAKAKGLADEIEEPVKMAAHFDLNSRFANAPAALAPEPAMKADDAEALKEKLHTTWIAYLQKHPAATERIVAAHGLGKAAFDREFKALWNAAQSGEGLPPPLTFEAPAPEIHTRWGGAGQEISARNGGAAAGLDPVAVMRRWNTKAGG